MLFHSKCYDVGSGRREQPGDDLIDHNDSVLTPGLIDTHVHLTFDHGADHAVTRAKVEASDLITLTLRDAIREGWLTGPRILAAGTPITTTAGHLHWCGCEADTAEEVRKAGVDFVKIMDQHVL